MAFNDRLTEERARLGLSQAAFASKVGISRNTQWRYEGGHTKPTTEYLERIKKIGVDADYVWFGGPKGSYLAGVGVREGIDGVLLASIIEALELALSRAERTASAAKKSQAIVMLYRSIKSTGKLDPKAVEEVALLAAD